MIRIVIAFVLGIVLALGWGVVKDLTREVPASVFVSEEAAGSAARNKEMMMPHMMAFITGSVEDQRKVLDEYFAGPYITEARQLYSVMESALEIDGVYTEVFEPADGIPEKNANRVLINLHGGGFALGARTIGRLESIPVAATARMKVISVDYRQGPEHRFPAASEDVATVYRHLLQTYKPEQIGIFGCSAGGILSAQAVAWFDAHDLPQPGAIGIFCAAAGVNVGGDSDVITKALGVQFPNMPIDYFEDADLNDPLVSPVAHPEVLAKFPPTLIINSTRDFFMSAALDTHRRLLDAGVESELHVYDGLEHFFFGDTSLPESKHAFNVTARFFDKYLAN